LAQLPHPVGNSPAVGQKSIRNRSEVLSALDWHKLRSWLEIYPQSAEKKQLSTDLQ
jgi:hypothetical protein